MLLHETLSARLAVLQPGLIVGQAKDSEEVDKQVKSQDQKRFLTVYTCKTRDESKYSPETKANQC